MSSTSQQIYVSTETGSDYSGDGTPQAPYKSITHALKDKGVSNIEILINNDKTNEFNKLSITELEQSLKSLHMTKVKIIKAIALVDLCVTIDAWVTTVRKQGKSLTFLLVRDGTGSLQIVLTDNSIITHGVLMDIRPECSVRMSGVIKKLPAGKKAPGNVELLCDKIEIIGHAPAGGLDSLINDESNIDTLMNQRHLQLRTPDMITIMKVRSHAQMAFRQHYIARGFYEVSPPTIVQTQCEGGSTLFKFNYFNEIAFLTQSSQLYLETLLPALGSVFCIAQSYRAELSRTRRHLAEYTHIEAELPFITFDDLLNSIEDLICDVVDRLLSNPESCALILQLNPNLTKFERPFLRMTYTDAIKYLKDNNITKDDGTHYEFGEDIPEAPERKMTDKINKPILLVKFPANIKAFYMQKDKEDARLTESVDLLLPNVGEVVGGSMRMYDEKELLEAYKKEGVDASPYYWYTDQRKFGTCEHGGYGLGFERFLTWLVNRNHIRDVCLYPRYFGRCTP